MKLITSEAAVELPEPGRRARQFEAREQRMLEAQEAANRRMQRGRERNALVTTRVADAQSKLDRPLAQARALLDDLSDSDLQVYLIAEAAGKNRKGVLQGFPPPSAALVAQYESELAAQRPADKE